MALLTGRMALSLSYCCFSSSLASRSKHSNKPPFKNGVCSNNAILQNLFFATLNRRKKNRSFRRTTNGKATNIYRYQDYFIDKDEQKIMALFEQTPFLNGGLFDREASDEEKQQYDKDKAIRPVKSAIRIATKTPVFFPTI
jgi:hypothetical protein